MMANFFERLRGWGRAGEPVHTPGNKDGWGPRIVPTGAGFSAPPSAALPAAAPGYAGALRRPGFELASLPSLTVLDGRRPEAEEHLGWLALQGARGEIRNLAANRALKQEGFVGWHACVPGVAVFSVVGGVGKTSIVAALSHALSSSGESSILVDTAGYGILPCYFGSQNSSSGPVRVFVRGDARSAPVHLFPYDRESGVELKRINLLDQVITAASGADRLILDIATASTGTARELFHLTSLVLAPLTPDLRSVLSVAAIEEIFAQFARDTGRSVKVYYVLNQFDSASAMHREIRSKLRRQLGESLLPVEIRRHAAVNEALAAGMTVLDYAPRSSVSRDYRRLAEWLRRSCGPPADPASRVRWSDA